MTEARERERAALAAVVEAKYGKMPPLPIRQPNETDEMFMARLRDYRERCLALTSKIRKPAKAEAPS